MYYINFLDSATANWINVIRDNGLIQFFTWVTLLGKTEIVFSTAIIMTAILWLRNKRAYLIPFWVTLGGAAVMDFLGKIVFHRARPPMAVYLEDSFSFPSGHATLAVALYGFLAYVLIRELKSRGSKVSVFFASLIVILLIGLSRIYLGVHYLSDVWGGYLLGFLWLLAGIALIEHPSKKD